MKLESKRDLESLSVSFISLSTGPFLPSDGGLKDYSSRIIFLMLLLNYSQKRSLELFKWSSVAEFVLVCSFIHFFFFNRWLLS